MIGLLSSNAELDSLRSEFAQSADAALASIKKLDSILSTLTAETYPLSPCDDCLFVHCMLRRVKTDHAS